MALCFHWWGSWRRAKGGVTARARRPFSPVPRLQLESLEERAVPALSLPSDPSLFVPVSETGPLAMHIHAEVQIFLDGQPLVIPANVGVFGLAAYPLHTHDSSGLVHIESPVVRDYSLQDLFAIWNTTAEGHAVLAMLDAAPYLTVTDDGVVSTGLPLVTLHDHDRIVIQALSASPSAAAAANEALVTKLYQDLLLRAPDTPGLVSLSTALDQGLSRMQVVQSMEASAEYHTMEVQNLYHAWLHRDADPAGQTGFVAFLALGG